MIDCRVLYEELTVNHLLMSQASPLDYITQAYTSKRHTPIKVLPPSYAYTKSGDAPGAALP